MQAQDTVITPKKRNIFPIFCSLLIHGAIIYAIIFIYKNKPLDVTKPLETSLVSAEQLSQMQQAAAAASLANASLNDLQNSDSTSNSSLNNDAAIQNIANSAISNTSDMQSLNGISRSENGTMNNTFERFTQNPEEMSEYNRYLYEKQKQYEEEQAKIAAELDREIEEEMRQLQLNKEQQAAEESRLIQEYKNKENQVDDITASNRAEMQAIAEEIAANNRRREIVQEATSRNFTSDTSSSTSSASNNSSASGQHSRSSSSNINRIKNQFLQAFIRPTNTPGETCTLVIKVDRTGRVISASATGSNSRLNKAAEDAANTVRKFSIDPNDSNTYPSITLQINGRDG